jgi:hypothetical protein
MQIERSLLTCNGASWIAGAATKAFLHSDKKTLADKAFIPIHADPCYEHQTTKGLQAPFSFTSSFENFASKWRAEQLMAARTGIHNTHQTAYVDPAFARKVT